MQVVLYPYQVKIFAIEAVATPFPTPDITPPQTKIYFGIILFFF
jgi:hypothetical protein